MKTIYIYIFFENLKQWENYMWRILTFVSLIGSKAKSIFSFATNLYNFILQIINHIFLMNIYMQINTFSTLMYFEDHSPFFSKHYCIHRL